MHYLVHKVAKAEVDERGVLRFKYEDHLGNPKPNGPFYPGLVNGEIPLAAKELAKSNLQSPDQVQYLVAYHSGAFPNGLPALLLQSLEEFDPAKFQ
jgi:hypothetical protein